MQARPGFAPGRASPITYFVCTVRGVSTMTEGAEASYAGETERADVSVAGGLAVIGIDPGARWTAGVLRVGDHAALGWTLGPVDAFGMPDPSALDNHDDWHAIGRYLDRVVEFAQRTAEYADKNGATRVRFAVEVPRVPTGFISGRYNRIPLSDWLMPQRVAAAVLAAFPGTRTVLPDQFGGKRTPTAEYPRELRGSRPPHWWPNETKKRERDHERAAFDVAGVAATMP